MNKKDIKVKCPYCATKVGIEDYEDCFDVDRISDKCIEYCTYYCPDCNALFYAEITYKLKYQEMVIKEVEDVYI